MKELKVTLPKPEADYFLYVDKAPIRNKIDIPQKLEKVMVNTGTHKVMCQLEDFLEYTMSQLWPSILCKLAYGLGNDELKHHVRKSLKITNNDERIAFYVFKILEKQDVIRPTHHAKLGLPSL